MGQPPYIKFFETKFVDFVKSVGKSFMQNNNKDVWHAGRRSVSVRPYHW